MLPDMPKAKPTPSELLAEAQALMKAAIAKEGEAIRAALEQSGWFEQPAAEMLGMKLSSLKSLLLPRRRHAEIGEKAARERARSGYQGGNPRRDPK